MAAVASQTLLDLSGIDAVVSAAKTRAMALKAVKAGAKLIQAAAKARAPRRPRSGALKQSIGIKPQKGTRGKTAAYAVVGARKGVVKQVPVARRPGRRKKVGGTRVPGGARHTIKAVPFYYSHLVEKGTRPHALKKGSRLARRGKPEAGQRGGRHPGAKAHPFLGPAFDATRAQAVKAAEAVLAAELAKVMAKAKPKRPGR